MRSKYLSASAGILAMSLAAPAFAATVVNGGDMIELNDGVVLNAEASDGQSTFSNEFAINGPARNQVEIGGLTYGTGEVVLGDLFATDGNLNIAYDIQEVGRDPETDINDIIIEVDGTEIWSYTGETLLFNSAGSVETDSPLGNGVDAFLSVPLDLLLNQGFTASSTLSFFWNQINDDNGFDEWVFSTTGDSLGGIDLNPGGGGGGGGGGNPPAPVPLPAGFPLMIAALGALGIAKRRKS